MKLSPHFSLAEFTASATATARGIDNRPNVAQINAMRLLCTKVLEPLRAHFGRPIRITSGFRSPRLCLAVGSKTSSQHAAGEAADFEITGIDNLTAAKYIRDRLPFDQLILENHVMGDPNSGWIHASYRDGRLRKQSLRYARGTYFDGLGG